ncbi:hypothetical protein Tco_0789260 [Tanacetum coccineum]
MQYGQAIVNKKNISRIEDFRNSLRCGENLMKDIQTFQRKFSRIPFGEIPKVLFYTIIYRKHKEITPDLSTAEPDNSLSMGDEHLNTILETEKSSVENFVPIPSEFKGIFDDICDVPSCDNDHFDAEFGLINSLLSRDILITSPKIDFLPEEFVGEFNFIDPILTRIDEDNFDEDDFDEEEGEIDNDILQIEDEILREKLLNVNGNGYPRKGQQ